MAGVDLPLEAVIRHKVVVPDLPAVPQWAPMTIDDDTGAHWRPALAGAYLLHTDPSTPPGPAAGRRATRRRLRLPAARPVEPGVPGQGCSFLGGCLARWLGVVDGPVRAVRHDTGPPTPSRRNRLWPGCGRIAVTAAMGSWGVRRGAVTWSTSSPAGWMTTLSGSTGTSCLDPPTFFSSRSCYITSSRYTGLVTDQFSALADATRRRMLELLASGDRTAGSLVAAFPGLSQPAVSRHLRVLRQAGLVSYRQRGAATHLLDGSSRAGRGREVARQNSA